MKHKIAKNQSANGFSWVACSIIQSHFFYPFRPLGSNGTVNTPRAINNLPKESPRMTDTTVDTFGKRLRFAMIQAGHKSARTPTQVNIHKLSEITQNSLQICRKYLRDEVFPNHRTTIKIATHLNVTPGWLLFGDNSLVTNKECLCISKTLLQYIFEKSTDISTFFSSNADFAAFLVHITTKVCELKLPDEQSVKIIDLMLSSARGFINSVE